MGYIFAVRSQMPSDYYYFWVKFFYVVLGDKRSLFIIHKCLWRSKGVRCFSAHKMD